MTIAVIGLVLLFVLIFVYTLLRGAATENDRAEEDKAQAEYLKKYTHKKREKAERKHRKKNGKPSEG